MASEEESKILISNDYPHSLMLHASELLKQKNIINPDKLAEDEFFEDFSKKFSAYPNEIRELQIAYEEDIIDGFVENKRASAWRKRVFVNTSLSKLVKEMKEYEAVELIESLMHLFRWEMEFAATRKWEVAEEDKANFHSFQKPSDSGDSDFEKKAREHIEGKKERRPAVRRRAVREAAQPEIELDYTPETGERKRRQRRTSQAGSTENTRRRQRREDIQEVQAPVEEAVPEYLAIEELSDDEYRKELAMIQIKHEALMSLSIRREIKKAKKGDATSQCVLGDFYAQEKTDHTDYEEAAKWYAFAARQGNFKAKLEMGKIFDSEKIEGKDTKQYGIRYFQELADEGYPTAQCIIGLKYYFGDGVDKNTSKGIQWLKKAGYQGHTEAQRQLGDIYAAIDTKEAAKWYEMAKLNGDIWAEKKLKALKG